MSGCGASGDFEYLQAGLAGSLWVLYPDPFLLEPQRTPFQGLSVGLASRPAATWIGWTLALYRDTGRTVPFHSSIRLVCVEELQGGRQGDLDAIPRKGGLHWR